MFESVAVGVGVGVGLGAEAPDGFGLGFGFAGAGAGAGAAACFAFPEFGLIISDEASTASNALAGIDFSSSSMSVDHPFSAVPVKNQSDPLSATIIP